MGEEKSCDLIRLFKLEKRSQSHSAIVGYFYEDHKTTVLVLLVVLLKRGLRMCDLRCLMMSASKEKAISALTVLNDPGCI